MTSDPLAEVREALELALRHEEAPEIAEALRAALIALAALERHHAEEYRDARKVHAEELAETATFWESKVAALAQERDEAVKARLAASASWDALYERACAAGVELKDITLHRSALEHAYERVCAERDALAQERDRPTEAR